MEMIPCEEEDLPKMQAKLSLFETEVLLTWLLSINFKPKTIQILDSGGLLYPS